MARGGADRAAHHAVVPGLPPQPGAEPASGRGHHLHDLAAARGPRGGRDARVGHSTTSTRARAAPRATAEAPKHPGAPMKDTSPTSFALPVVGDATRSRPPPRPRPRPYARTRREPLRRAAAACPPRRGVRAAGYGKAYWRSIEEKLATPEYLEAERPEFPEGADLPPSGFMRREFMQLLGASLALAGVTACTTRPGDEKMLPYTKTPPSLVPGNPLTYASGFTFGGPHQRPARHRLGGSPHQGGGQPPAPGEPGRRRSLRAGDAAQPL